MQMENMIDSLLNEDIFHLITIRFVSHRLVASLVDRAVWELEFFLQPFPIPQNIHSLTLVLNPVSKFSYC